MNPTPHPEQYWATLPTAEFAEQAFSKMNSQGVGGAYALYSRNVSLSFVTYYGALDSNGESSTAEISRKGDQGNIVTLRVNSTRSLVDAKHAIVTGPELTWTCQATNSDAQSLAAASRGSAILEYLWKTEDYGSQSVEAVLEAILFGESFLFTYWDADKGEERAFDAETQRLHYTGDIACVAVPSWDVFRDPNVRAFDRSDWLVARIPLNKWDLIAKYPDHREKILSASFTASTFNPIGGLTSTEVNPDQVLTYFLFHKKTLAQPAGRMAVMLSPECALEDAPLPPCYETLPIHRMAAGDIRNTPWPYSSYWDTLAQSELVDDIEESLATNIVTFGKQLISAENNQDLAPDQLANGPVVIYRAPGSKAPEALQLTASPPEAFKHLDRLRQNMRQMMGLNDISMGQPETAQMNAQAFALLASMAIQQNSDLQKRYVKFVARVGKSILAIYKANQTEPKKIAIVGVHGASVPRQDAFDRTDFEGLSDVVVEVGNPIAQTAAGRLELAKLFKEQGFIQTPEQLQAVVETGKLEPLTQVLRDELIYVASENEMILKGQQPRAKITDSHQLHIREHRGPTFSSEARANDAINLAADAHIKEHLEFLMNTNPQILAVLGQAAPPPAMPQAANDNVEKAAGGVMADPLSGQAANSDVELPEAPDNPLTAQPFDKASGGLK